MRTIVAVGFVLPLLFCGCGQASYRESASALMPAEAQEMAHKSPSATPPGTSAAPGAAVPQNVLQRKIVYTAEVHLTVENFDPIPSKVNELLKQFGAVIAHSNLTGSPGMPRSGEWTIRVSVDRYNDFVAATRQLGEIRAVKSDSRDVTEEYYDVEARIRNKKQEEQRLLKLLDTAAGSLKDILEIERELSRVREEVERMEGRLRVLNDLTSLSTVKLHIEEVKGYVPERAATFATRARRAFQGSLSTLLTTGQGLSLGLIAFAPWAGVLFVVGAPVLVWRRRRGGRRPDNSVGP